MGEEYKKYIASQKQEILKQLDGLNNKLFQELISKLDAQPKLATSKSIGEKLFSTLEENCLALFDILLQASADTLKQDSGEMVLSHIHTLFCLFASLMAPKSVAARQAITRFSVYSKMATELAIAPMYDINPNFDLVDGEVQGKYAMDASVFTRETGWKVDEFQDEAVKIVSLGVTGKNIKDPRSAFELKKLNTTIKQRQNRSFNQLHRFELNSGDNKYTDNPLYCRDFCEALQAKLPDFPIIHYGEAEAELEAELSAKIEELFELLKTYGYPI